ncbi:MAG: alpha/beta hydrolase [Actinomycetales bacterium]
MGDQASVVLCHGFTSSPATLGYWADGLRAGGCRVAVPRLPGHDTTWQQLNRTGWQDWYARVERELLDLHSVLGRPIFVGGLSMGGALALRLAQRHPQLVAGLLLVNPCVLLDDPRLRLLPVLRRVRASIPGIASDIAKPGVAEFAYDRTPLHALASSLELFADAERRLSAVTAPVIVFRSPQDHVVPPRSAERVLTGVSSRDVTDVKLPNSYHVATMDHDAALVVADSLAFIGRLNQTHSSASESHTRGAA